MLRQISITIFLLFVIWSIEAKNPIQNFFVKDVFEQNGVAIHYSGVVQIEFKSTNNFANNQDGELALNLYLSSFYVDYLVYQNKKITGHQLFGYTFPAEMLAILQWQANLIIGNQNVNFDTDISSYRPINYSLSKENTVALHSNIPDLKNILTKGNDLQFQIIKTKDIVFPRKNNFFDSVIKAIQNNKTLKSEAETNAEYERLLREGNLFLSQNNYKQAYQSFVVAKRYATTPAFINSKIDLVAGLETNSRNSNFRWKPNFNALIVDNELLNDKISTNRNNFQIKVSDTLSNKFYPQQNTNPKHKFNIKNQNTISSKREVETSDTANKINSNPPNVEVEDNIFVSIQETQISNTNSILSKQKSTKKYDTNRVVLEENMLNKATGKSEDKLEEISEEREVQRQVDKSISLKTTTAFSPFEKRGYIKYKRDTQAVVDDYNRLLIPFGKYEILRYRAGFANVKIKDTVALKTIVCTGQNGEYTWSARIYQNPWQETVVDKNGRYVDDFTKKVEIYVVDNVTLVPYADVSPELKKKYKDPNPHAGTDFISAFKLWERQNAKRPLVIARREEIQAYREASKMEAYLGADTCKAQVLQSLAEVVQYFENLGYEIYDRNTL